MSTTSPTRRQFLAIGALASALAITPTRKVLSATSPHSGTHTPIEEQLRRLRDKHRDKPAEGIQVAILGAGIAGLVAAHELKKLGYNVTVLEASNRPGGRIWTKRFDDGQYHELGAMRIPASHDYSHHYVQEFGLPLRRFVTSHKEGNAFYRIAGVTTRINEAQGLFDRFQLSTLEAAQASAIAAPYIYGAALDGIIGVLSQKDRDALFGRGEMTELVDRLDKMSLGEYLDRVLNGTEAKELTGAVTGLTTWFDGQYAKSATMFIRDEIVGTGDDLKEIAGGMDLLPSALARSLRKKSSLKDTCGVVLYNTEVRGIFNSARKNAVKLVLQERADEELRPEGSPPKEKGQPYEVFFDFVICTIPFPAIRKRRIGNDFCCSKWEAIEKLTYASSTKVLLHCRNRFWESKYGIFGGASHSDEISRATYYPSDNAGAAPPQRLQAFLNTVEDESPRALDPYHRRARGSFSVVPDTESDSPLLQSSLRAFGPSRSSDVSGGPGVLVGSYTWDAEARELGNKARHDDHENDERVLAVRKVVAKFHPEIDEAIIGHESIAWDNHAWAGGAFCFMAPGDLGSHYPKAIAPEGRVHFAGEHCSTDPGWIQGALISALRAAEEVILRVASGGVQQS